MASGDQRTLSALTCIHSTPSITQRLLARHLGIALGSANALIQTLLHEKWIKLTQDQGRTRYRLTETGLAEKLRLLELQLQHSIEGYAALRDRISGNLQSLAGKRVGFYGAGDLAQIESGPETRCCE